MSKNKPLKTVIVGGASITWLPVFLKDLCKSKAMEGGTVVLNDIDTEMLNTMKTFSEAVVAEKGCKITIETETDLEKTLIGADYVICTVLVGGHAVWKDEMNLILKYGIKHPKGMSIGPGGMIMGLKQIPFILGLAKRMEKLCPDAWLLNFSNPMQLITLAVQRYSSIKCIGLCHGLDGTIAKIAEWLEVPVKELSFTAGGVNHFEFVTRLEKDGVDMFPALIGKLEEIDRTTGDYGDRATMEAYKLFGAFPTNHDIHVLEFLPYQIVRSELEKFRLTHNYIENRMADRGSRWEKLHDYINGKRPLSEIVKEKVTEKLAEIIDSIATNTPYVLYANVTNKGYIRNLGDYFCVGVPVVLNRDGYEGCCIGNLPVGAAALSGVHGAVQDYIVEACMSGSRKLCLSALSLDPMCYSLTSEQRMDLINELIDMNQQYLPAFFENAPEV